MTPDLRVLPDGKQFMEFMARILSSVPADGDRGDGSGSPEEDVNLLHVRNIASVIGVIVGILGEFSRRLRARSI